MPNIITLAEAEASSKFYPDMKVWHSALGSGELQELIWAKFEPDGHYPMHTHPYEQVSVVIQGRMRLTVGEEVREVGPGDMWLAPAGVPHGGEILGDEALIFIDVYAPPSGGDESAVMYL